VLPLGEVLAVEEDDGVRRSLVLLRLPAASARAVMRDAAMMRHATDNR
jgi:hypothetical protein